MSGRNRRRQINTLQSPGENSGEKSEIGDVDDGLCHVAAWRPAARLRRLGDRTTAIDRGRRGNAFKAAFKDPRFQPLRFDELDGLDWSIALLTSPAPIQFVDELNLLAQLRPNIDGLIIEDGPHRASSLPAMWRHFPTRVSP